MKLPVYLLTLICLLVTASGVSADVCIKQRAHTDEYYYGGRVTPAEDSESEIWIAADRMSYLSPQRQIIVDAEHNTLTFVNKRDSTYVEAELPFNWTKLTTDEMVETLDRYRTRGTVEASGPGEEISGWDCHLYDVKSWITTEDGKYNERDAKMWATRDLPIDWERFRVMHLPLLKLLNYDEEMVAAFDAMPGFVIRMEADRWIHGFSVKSIEEVVEVQEMAPHKGVYSVPEGFEKKESLSMADLRG